MRALSARRFGAVNGQVERGEEARPIVLEAKLALVQVGDRSREREAEPGAFVRTARIEPAEPARGFFAAVERDAGPAVGDLQPDSLVARLDSNLDLAA